MTVRTAQDKDLEQLLRLLSEVLELHASLRPDIFIPGTTKYTASELAGILRDPKRRTYVAVDEADNVLGYAFCVLRQQPFTNTMRPFTSFFIDDFCVDSAMRGQQIGKQLFLFLKEEAKKLGCYDITLNVWAGNDGAKLFYEKMGLFPKETQMELILDK